MPKQNNWEEIFYRNFRTFETSCDDICYKNLKFTDSDIKQFISALRQSDMLELIKRLMPIHELGQEEVFEGTESDFIKEGYNKAIKEMKQLINDYYQSK